MIAAVVLVDIDTALWTGARHFLDSFRGSRFLFHTALGSDFFLFDGALLVFLVLVAGLAFVERHIAEETVAGVAHLAGEDIPVVLDEECACALSPVSLIDTGLLSSSLNEPHEHSALGHARYSSSLSRHSFRPLLMYLDPPNVRTAFCERHETMAYLS